MAELVRKIEEADLPKVKELLTNNGLKRPAARTFETTVTVK